MKRLSDDELERRVLAGLTAEIELFGSGADSSRVLRLPGLIASISPATPDRSIFNSVYAEDPGALADSIDELEATYADAGVRAWTVWLPDGHRVGRELLEPRGHAYDGSPRSMALELDDLLEPAGELPGGVSLLGGNVREAALINDRAYGLGPGAWASAMTRAPNVPVRWAVAVWDGEPVACAAALDVGDDASITAVGTVPERKGNGLAGRLIHALLTEAADRGARTGSLQASRAGAPVYTRLGFRDLGCTDLWERRTSDPAASA